MSFDLDSTNYDENDVPFDVDEDTMEKEPLVHEEDASYDVAQAEEASREFVGRWNRLISQTNWEKGKVIAQWRSSMIASGVPVQLYSDEAWSRRVGNVTGQHVGRLRRVYERFGEVYSQYAGLYWSHFQAALDWNDAEIWLEGAVQQRWSVSKMRNQRWVAIGAPAELKPKDDEVITSELDEDVVTSFDSEALSGATGMATLPEGAKTLAEYYDEPTDGLNLQGKGKTANAQDTNSDDDDSDSGKSKKTDDKTQSEDEMRSTVTSGPLFGNMPKLPEDLDEAFEMMKLAILNHKLANWKLVPKEAVLEVLEKLRVLTEN